VIRRTPRGGATYVQNAVQGKGAPFLPP